MGEPGGFGPVTPLVEVRRGGQTEGVRYDVGVIASSHGAILGVAGNWQHVHIPAISPSSSGRCSPITHDLRVAAQVCDAVAVMLPQ